MKLTIVVLSGAAFVIANYLAYCLVFDLSLLSPYRHGGSIDFFAVLGNFRINAAWEFGFHQVVPWIFLLGGPLMVAFNFPHVWWKKAITLFAILYVWELGVYLFQYQIISYNASFGPKLVTVVAPAVTLAIICFGGFGLSKLVEIALEKSGLGRAPLLKRKDSLWGGFTLVELLVVIAIIAVLTAILFPVLAKSKERANLTVDISNMRQVYTAMVLYEEDNGSPLSLVQLLPYAKSKELFRSPSDPIKQPLRSDYPADLYVTTSKVRSSFRISYGYLHSFVWAKFHSGGDDYVANNWNTWRADPTMGVIGLGLYNPISPVDTFEMPYSEHDHMRIVSKFYRLNMDGSLYVRKVNNFWVFPGGLWGFTNNILR